jgi:hypothetical protein
VVLTLASARIKEMSKFAKIGEQTFAAVEKIVTSWNKALVVSIVPLTL